MMPFFLIMRPASRQRTHARGYGNILPSQRDRFGVLRRGGIIIVLIQMTQEVPVNTRSVDYGNS